MNFGFIGSESEWQVIQPAFGDHSVDRLLAAVIDEPHGTSSQRQPQDQSIPISGLPAATRRVRDFEELLANAQLDAVILGGPIDKRSNRLRQLSQLGRHCVCLHPADTSPLFYHEVALIAKDHGTTLMPWLPARLHPACQSFIEICRSGTLGVVKFITIERSGLIPIGRLMTAGSYAEAVDVLWLLGGQITEVSSTGDRDVGRVVVHHRMSSGASAEIRLQRSALTSDSWTIVVDAEHHTAKLTFQNGLDGPATLRQSDHNATSESEYTSSGQAGLLLAEFSKAVRHQPHAIKWSDAIRAIELADWAWYSLERRRAVDIFHEERGELASFKGRMTSLGCGLIWITLFVLIVIAIGKGLHLPGMDLLAGVTAVVWLVFLLFQSARWALDSEGRSGDSS